MNTCKQPWKMIFGESVDDRHNSGKFLTKASSIPNRKMTIIHAFETVLCCIDGDMARCMKASKPCQ